MNEEHEEEDEGDHIPPHGPGGEGVTPHSWDGHNLGKLILHTLPKTSKGPCHARK